MLSACTLTQTPGMTGNRIITQLVRDALAWLQDAALSAIGVAIIVGAVIAAAEVL